MWEAFSSPVHRGEASKGEVMGLGSHRASKATWRALACTVGKVGATGGIRDRPSSCLEGSPWLPRREQAEQTGLLYSTAVALTAVWQRSPCAGHSAGSPWHARCDPPHFLTSCL